MLVEKSIPSSPHPTHQSQNLAGSSDVSALLQNKKVVVMT